MREIKFRGIDLKGNWQYGHYAYFCQYPDSISEHYILPEGWIIDPNTLGQFTALKDKNGKEIYEGDILKHPTEKNWFPWLVEFHNGSFCIINIGIDGYHHEPMYLTMDRSSSREVIGNIYENPELLT